MSIHPAMQIMSWCAVAMLLQILAPSVLLVASVLILAGAISFARHRLVLVIRRTRWIILSLMLVYAYASPGQPVFQWLGVFSPSREGAADGALQLLRLVTALAALAVLLESVNRQKLIAGLYTLLAPLALAGVSRERLAVRLALTLQYAEVIALHRATDWQDRLRSLFEPHDELVRQVELPVSRFGFGDAVVMTIMMAAIWIASR